MRFRGRLGFWAFHPVAQIMKADLHGVSMEVQRIVRGDACYPKLVADRLGDAAPKTIYSVGAPHILRHRPLV